MKASCLEVCPNCKKHRRMKSICKNRVCKGCCKGLNCDFHSGAIKYEKKVKKVESKDVDVFEEFINIINKNFI